MNNLSNYTGPHVKATGCMDRIIGQNSLGFIEDVYGTQTSFNIYRWVSHDEKTYRFIRSCYKHSTAMKVLGNFVPKRQPKHLQK